MVKRLYPLFCLLFILAVLCTGCQSAGSLPAPPTSSPQASGTTARASQTATEMADTPGEIIASVQNANNGQRYELPVEGASGYTTVASPLYEGIPGQSTAIGQLAAGECFRILAEDNDTWRIETASGLTGYLRHECCFINLADIVPSIVYRISNSATSLFRSSGKYIPGVTGRQLYNTYCRDERFQREQYVVPVLYAMAPKVYEAQQAALRDGNTLVIYETYRPRSVQKLVSSRLQALSETDPDVRSGLTGGGWNLSWFIATGLSNHQKGCAMDVSLARVDAVQALSYKNIRYVNVTGYTEYTMQSPMHELSVRSVSMAYPVSDNVWQSTPVNELMTQESLLLRKYCTDAGLSPLASEWWHFNDLSAIALLGNRFVTDDYDFSRCMSR